jgi:hypothetical protein
MNVSEDQFVREVLNHLAEEHGALASVFEYLTPKIHAAYATEGVTITPDELSELIHGDGDAGVPKDLEERFPLLNAIGVAPYIDADLEADKSAQVEKAEEEAEEEAEAEADEDDEDGEDEDDDCDDDGSED